MSEGLDETLLQRRYPTSVVIGEMMIKTIIRYCFTPTIDGFHKKKKMVVGEDVEKLETYAGLMGM